MTAARAGNLLTKSQEMQFLEIAKDKKWQGKLFRIGWDDDSLSITSCFAWLRGWATCPTYTIAGMYELYEQLLPTKLYTKEKTQTSTDGEVLCRLCGKVAERVAHVLAGCSSLAQTKYLYKHNAALKILFFELLREHGLIEEVPPWFTYLYLCRAQRSKSKSDRRASCQPREERSLYDWNELPMDWE